MGALAPISPWIPEDDLLLKNAVEAGASLESLAKGAVQFSRRFTIRELQERWHSLLYDPDISAEASARMIEFERSTSTVNSKSSRVESSKESKGDRKRKFQSVRRCYYAMRKRICTDPLNQGGLNFLVENCFGNGNEAGGPSNNLGDPMGDHFQLGNTNYDDLHHVFRQDVGNSIDGASHEFENGDGGRVENRPIEQGHICNEIPQVVDSNMSLSANCTAVGAVDSLKRIPLQNPFEDKIDMNPLSNGDNSDNNNSMYPGLEGNHVFNSPVSECEASFHHLQYSSPPPPMDVWRNMESMSAMEISGDSQLGGKNPQAGDAFGIPDGASKRSSGYDIVNSETDFQSHIACDEIKTSASCTQLDLVAISDTLLNYSDDEMLLMDDDGKEIDKYGLSNLLLDSPADVNEDQMLNVTEAETSVVTVADLRLPSRESAEQVDKSVSDLDTSGLVPMLEEQKPSSISDIKTQLPELCDGVICCTLNTEDLEVPFNDEVIFPGKSCLALLNRRGFNELSHHASSVKDISNKQASETGLSLVNREMKKFEELHARGKTVGVKHASEFDAKFELPKSESISTNSRHPGTASCSTLVVKEVGSETVSGKQSCSDLPGLGVKVSDGFNSHFETCGLGVKQEGQVIRAVKKSEVRTQLGTTDEIAPEPAGEPLLSDIEEQFSDNDSDIPYFSDIESMILDMDLGPEDLDSYSSKQVAMYQSEDAKRAIIRLEQSAHAYMQRAIASHGAFAVLYGRHSKHYIKKPEVLLGRATEDVIVDIDLGKEGRANKISRRQAIIKMDEDGVFHLRNLGKCPISVDNKEVYPGQSLVLHSNCLIEVREMPFIFEKTQARVKQYLDATASKMPPK